MKIHLWPASTWVLLLAGALVVAGCQYPKPVQRVVLYCSQDREYAEDFLAEFTRRTGIVIDIRGDTEANKTVGLYEAIVREAHQPRCDVFWCNEPVLMERLSQKGLLEPYVSPSAQSYPAWSRPADNSWQGFAARARVLIAHQKLAEADIPKSLEELAQPRWEKRWGMAKPFYGTTATHAACLWQLLGKENAQILLARLATSAVLLPGNKDVAQAVGEGHIVLGLTDTDDAMVMIDKKLPVRIHYLESGTLYLPNTLALIRNAPHPEAARKLIDYLLSE
ncbi:MAG TPA: extracellular solute-binding protein, partial [Gemmatales bacterium]|nr:extracellular solute-binding protein [Gemmatales bacterium]